MLRIFFLLLGIISLEQEEKLIIDVTSPKYKPVKVSLESSKDTSSISDLIKRNLKVIGYVELVESSPDVLLSLSREDDSIVLKGFFGKGKDPIFVLRAKSESQTAIASALSNQIISKITGLKVDIFGRKLFFLSNEEGKKEIYSMDFLYGKAEKFIQAKSFIPFFSVSPDASKIALVHFNGKEYSLYIADSSTKKLYTTSIKFGMFLSPYFSDNDNLIIPWNDGKGANIYVLNLKEKSFKKITSGNSDVMGKITPDGKSLIFVSGRLGLPQIFIKDLKNGRESVLPLSGNYNTSPDISPDGKKIVFSKLEGNRFNIYIYDFDRSDERSVITNFGSAENPTWTPDGNFIIFSSNVDGDYDLYITDQYGNFKNKIFDTQKKDETMGVLK